jgi:magnesium-transporting ATPase (P-type)
MITGDHELTAKAIAAVRHNHLRQRRYLEEQNGCYQKRVFRYSGTCVFMRVNPEQKLKL